MAFGITNPKNLSPKFVKTVPKKKRKVIQRTTTKKVVKMFGVRLVRGQPTERL